MLGGRGNERVGQRNHRPDHECRHQEPCQLSASFWLLFACFLEHLRPAEESVDDAGPAVEPVVVALRRKLTMLIRLLAVFLATFSFLLPELTDDEFADD
jgi:hypothetical protein